MEKIVKLLTHEEVKSVLIKYENKYGISSNAFFFAGRIPTKIPPFDRGYWMDCCKCYLAKGGDLHNLQAKSTQTQTIPEREE